LPVVILFRASSGGIAVARQVRPERPANQAVGGPSMLARSGFARLRPLIAIAALAGGTVALLACERPGPRPPQPVRVFIPVPYDGGCSEVPAPVPSFGMIDFDGNPWRIEDIPGHLVEGLDLLGAEWCGVDLGGARLVYCDFSRADLRRAELRRSQIYACSLGGADLTDADLTGAKVYSSTFDRSTRWPAGFNPKAHGARLDNRGGSCPPAA
jgi:hypothetical protein